MDYVLCWFVCCARDVSDVLELGLYVQHGSQCSGGYHPERALDVVQHYTVSGAAEDMDNLARAHCCMDNTGNES